MELQPPVYFIIGLQVMMAFHLLAPVVQLIGSPWRYLGIFPVLAGIIFNLWADRLFKKYSTEVKPFRDSSVLIVRGPYRISRNPMYLGGLLIYLGTLILLGSATPVLVVIVMVWLFWARFITPEEQDMERQFGERYLEYKSETRRWL